MAKKIYISIGELQKQQEKLNSIANNMNGLSGKYSKMLDKMTSAIGGKISLNISLKSNLSKKSYAKLASNLKLGADMVGKVVEEFSAADQSGVKNVNEAFEKYGGSDYKPENTNHGSSSSGGNGGGSSQVVVNYNNNTGTSKGNAEANGMTYYCQGKSWNQPGYQSDFFISSTGNNYEYKTGVSCGICCDAMVLSHFGYNYKPGDLLEAQNGNASWDGKGVSDIMANSGLTKTKYGSGDDALKQAIAAYQADPVHNAPPLVCMSNENTTNHYILVTGIDEAGNYIVADPGYNVSVRAPGSFTIKGVSVFSKN